MTAQYRTRLIDLLAWKSNRHYAFKDIELRCLLLFYYKFIIILKTFPAVALSQSAFASGGSPQLPELWGEEEPPHEVKAYQTDTLTEYGERRRGRALHGSCKPNQRFGQLLNILCVGFCQHQATWKSLQKLIHFLVQKLKVCNEKKKKVSKI